MQIRAAVIAMVVLVATMGAVAAPAASQEASGEAYSGAHVEFQPGSNSIADYAVDGNVLVENVTVQSAGEAREQSGAGVDAGLETAADFRGAGLEIASQTSVGVTMQSDSGAEMRTYDNERGVLQIRASEDDQMVKAQLGDGAEASSEGDGDGRVVVEHEDGSQGTFLVVGDGDVTVDENGDVVAEVRQGGELVYRQYESGERDENDEESERMIQEGVATAEVYVQEADEESDDAGQATTHAVEYGQDTTVDVASQGQDEVEMTVERSQEEGKVVLASVSEAAMENAQDLEVYVDGEAAAQADSYSAVEQSAQEGDQPRYYVAQSSSAEAAADVAIGIDHFSERTVTMTTDDGGDTTEGGDGDGDGDGDTMGDGAGFGALAALSALAAALIAARRS